MKSHGEVDVAIIGGGINGVGIARDAAGRGLSVLLCEKGDLGEGTSSRSGKLVHGGLRYLEHYEFRLVREALIEREVLLAAAPHIMWPMRFVLPHDAAQRSRWMVRAGLFLYDHLGGRKVLPGCRTLHLGRDPAGAVIKPSFALAFEYSDCWVDDARLVVLNAIDASERGALILPRTAAVRARRSNARWHLELRDADGQSAAVAAKALVNAAGPWVEDILGRVAGAASRRRIRQVKGSHVVVRKFWQGEHAYLFQNTDKRVIFVNPYEGELCLIGTTDIPYSGRPEDVAIEPAEIDYLLAAVNRYCRKLLSRSDLVASFSGVRPLYDDNAENPSAVTRDYLFDVDGAPTEAPLLSVCGGKITTYRKLAEHALERLSAALPGAGRAWTAMAPLPGGDMPADGFEQFAAELARAHPRLDPAISRHYARLYGTRAGGLLAGVGDARDLGEHFGARLYAREIEYLRASEWASSAEDVLDRRTKHGLHLSAAQRARVAAFMT